MRLEVTSPAITQTLFELPQNESTRLYIRLQQHFKILKQALKQPTETHIAQGLHSLIHIISIADRPDIKSKITQTLTQIRTSLHPLKHIPNVDDQRLHHLLEHLQAMLNHLHSSSTKIGHQLKQNEFINQLLLQSNIPGGICASQSPMYQLWLQQGLEKRFKDFSHWCSYFNSLQINIEFILNMLNQCPNEQQETAIKGNFHKNLDPNSPSDLIKVIIAADYNVFPELSSGKHRITLRFLEPNYHSNIPPQQTQNDIEFNLSFFRF